MNYNNLWRPAIPAALAAGTAVLFIFISGGNPAEAAAALWAGAFANEFAIADMLTRAAPLLITGLAISLAFRAGALNIGAEGQMLMGASAAVFVGLQLHNWPRPFAIVATVTAAGAGGLLAASLPALLRRYRNVPEVLSTILFNFIFAEMVSWLVRGPLQEASRENPQSDAIAEGAMFPKLLPPTSLHLGFFVAIAFAAALWIYLFRTAGGLRLRASGLSPRAALFAGFAPDRMLMMSMFVSGAMAGVSGGMIVNAQTGRLYSDISGGIGYIAIAVALLGRLHPIAIIGSALLFGALEAGAAEMQRTANVSSALAQVVEAVALFGVLATERSLQYSGASRTSTMVQADGVR
ncbi:MAG: ABC transporter permease [Planctomycetota bacterium]